MLTQLADQTEYIHTLTKVISYVLPICLLTKHFYFTMYQEEYQIYARPTGSCKTTPIDHKETPPPEEITLIQRVLRGWLRLSGPGPHYFSTSIEDQERKRRSRLLSALFALVLVPVILAIPTAIPVPTY